MDKKLVIAFGVVLFLCCLLLMGCALVKLKEEYNKSLETTVITGRIKGTFADNGPIIVAARGAKKGKGFVNYTVLHESGEYEFAVEQGDYYIFAYQDKNSNLIYEAGEPAGQYGAPDLVHARAVGVVYDVDIQIPPEGDQIAVPYGAEIARIKPEKLYSRQAGVITDLDDERFSEENGVKGFWEYGSFFDEFGGNIYFLEPYDPDKIPILFIHGATGTPSGWKKLIDHLDRDRFQPWFYYYPSGTRINSMANLLFWKLTSLQTKYQFDQLYITAHSMGGLVARSFIVNYDLQFPFVKLFISLATPWGGDHMAELGVKQSPVLIPSWIDMQPEGDFIKSLYLKKMPEHVSFYMFCGHRGNRNPFRSNNDGTIALSSLLDYRPQAEAKMNYTFDEDHVSILYSDAVIAQYNTILDQVYEKQGAPTQRTGGYIKVNVTYNFEFNGIRPRSLLALLSAGKKNNLETITYLSDEDNGKVLGPFPAGNYRAAMAAMAARPHRKYISISIEDGKTKEVNFQFEPDGEIYGCVTAALAQDDKYIGRPDIAYRSSDENIRIQSLQLNGNDVDRSIEPVDDDNFREDYLIERQDYCYEKCFGFFGLPAGEYTLHLKADGYEAVEKKYSITPGVPVYFRATELTPE